MMARKKEKIRVDLELPKDDNTQSTFVAILLIGMLMGIVSLGFWVTNADLVFKPVNGNPMFLNLACPDSFDPMDPTGPTYYQNQTCWLTEESPNEEQWVESWPRVRPPGLAKSFHVPGMSATQRIDNGQQQQHPPTHTCTHTHTIIISIHNIIINIIITNINPNDAIYV